MNKLQHLLSISTRDKVVLIIITIPFYFQPTCQNKVLPSSYESEIMPNYVRCESEKNAILTSSSFLRVAQNPSTTFRLVSAPLSLQVFWLVSFALLVQGGG